MRFRPRPFTITVLVGALVGLLFASVSTYDFAMHLDRAVHDVHCSFVPGLSGTEAASGCQVTLISTYSSVFRQSVWGGLPISLPAMGVFAFLLFFALELTLSGRQHDSRAAGFLVLATAVPAITSAIMAYISLVELDAVCKLCIGIYTASAISLVGGLGLWLQARKQLVVPEDAVPAPEDRGSEPAWVGASPAPEPRREAPARRPATIVPERAPVSLGYLAAVFGVGVLFVAIPAASYLAAAPDHSRFVGACGALAASDDPYGVMLEFDPHPGKAPAIEILDPLCPACRGFEQRLRASGLDAELNRKVLLFPLDNTCNWMVDQAVHPGACAVSKAMLCAGPRAGDVLEWAFENQEDIRAAAASDPRAAAALIEKYFPELTSCVGSAEVKARLNRSLRWAVRNQLPVLTPQLYVGGVKLCDEDVDLGLDYTLSRMLKEFQKGTLRASTATGAPAENLAPPAEEPPPAAGSTSAAGEADEPPAGSPTGADPSVAPPGGARPGEAPPGEAPPGQPRPDEAEPEEAPPDEPAGGDEADTADTAADSAGSADTDRPAKPKPPGDSPGAARPDPSGPPAGDEPAEPTSKPKTGGEQPPGGTP